MCRNCASPGGLTGQAAQQEYHELRELLDNWLVSGILKGGEITWDPQEGCHWVKVLPYGNEVREYTAAEFEAYSDGLVDALEAAKWQK